MKNIILIAVMIPYLCFSQEKGLQNNNKNLCGTDEYMKEMYKKYPEMKRKHEQIDSVLKDIKEGKIKIANYEDTTAIRRDTIRGKTKNEYGIESTQEVIPWVVRIPVVVHVVYKNATENISDAQIQSQITALSQIFRRLNASAANTPSAFASLARDARLEFCLATIDPNGNSTNGITRTSTSTQSFFGSGIQINAVKFNNRGGKDIWNKNNYLNIWVCDLDGGLAGYAQFPTGYSPNPNLPSGPETDGVVMDYTYFGTLGTATTTGFTQGTITAHEVGHWLGLYHIFGNEFPNNSNCTDDAVDDTPIQQYGNAGACPTFPKTSCSNSPNGEMFMNYMDYSNGDCMNMFTAGQRDRMMNAIYVSRNIFSTYNNISVEGNPIASDNYGSNKSLTSTGKVNSGSTVNFRSGDMVRLQPGFRANQGSFFRAKANECVCSGILANITQHNPYRISYDSSKQKSSNSISTLGKKLLGVYPNPTTNKSTTIEYNVEKKGMVRIYIMNSLGMHVRDLVFDYNHLANKYLLQVDLSDLASGFYYIAYKDFDSYEVAKIIVE